MHINLQMIVLFSMTAVSCFLGISIFHGRLRGPGSKTVGFPMFDGSLWLAAFALEIGSSSYHGKIFWDTVNHLASVLLPFTWLIFVLQFSGREHLVTERNLVFLSIVPLILVLLILTNQSQGFMWRSIESELDVGSSFHFTLPEKGIAQE